MPAPLSQADYNSLVSAARLLPDSSAYELPFDDEVIFRSGPAAVNCGFINSTGQWKEQCELRPISTLLRLCAFLGNATLTDPSWAPYIAQAQVRLDAGYYPPIYLSPLVGVGPPYEPPGPTSPRDVAGLSLWLNAQPSSSGFSDGDYFTYWSDLSGSIFGFQPLGDGQHYPPTFAPGAVNGFSGVYFGHLNTLFDVTPMETGDTLPASPLVIMGVAETFGSAPGGSIFSVLSGEEGYVGFQLHPNNGTVSLIASGKAPDGVTQVTLQSEYVYTANTPIFFAYVDQGPAGPPSLWVSNAGPLAPADYLQGPPAATSGLWFNLSSPSGHNALEIGAEGTAFALGELLVFHGSLSLSDIHSMFVYLQNGWTGTPPALVPQDIPVATAATSITPGSFVANWLPNDSDSLPTDATGYYFAVATDADMENILDAYNYIDVGYAFAYPVTGLTPGTNYWFQVIAYNAVGVGAHYSNAQPVTTTATTPPTSFSGLTVWLDASNPVRSPNTFPTDGGSLNLWQDQSGNGNDFSGTGLTPPKFSASGFNGKPGVVFSSNNYSALHCGTSFPSSPWTVFLVVQPTARGINQNMTYLGADSGLVGEEFNPGNGWFAYRAPGYNGVVQTQESYGGNPQRLVFVYQAGGTDSPYFWAEDTKLDPLANPGAYTSTAPDPTNNWLFGAWYLGTQKQQAGTYLNGTIAEVIAYNRVLLDSEVASLSQYLSYKWGV
jgi:hypothetical protein